MIRVLPIEDRSIVCVSGRSWANRSFRQGLAISRTQVRGVSAAPQKEMAALRQLARTGDMRAIGEQARRLLALDER